MTMVKTLVALATERMLLKTSGPTFLRGIEFMYAAGLAPDRLSVMMTCSHKFVLQFHSKCDIRPFAANYPNFARVLRGIVHVRAWRIKSIEFVNVAFHMRDVENLERAIEKLGVELVLLRNCTYPGVSRGEEAVKFLSALNRKKQAVVCEYGDDRLKHRIARRSQPNRVRRPSRLLGDGALARLNADGERRADGDPLPAVGVAPPPAAHAGVGVQAQPIVVAIPAAVAAGGAAPRQFNDPIDPQVLAMAIQLLNDQQAHLHGLLQRGAAGQQQAAVGADGAAAQPAAQPAAPPRAGIIVAEAFDPNVPHQLHPIIGHLPIYQVIHHQVPAAAVAAQQNRRLRNAAIVRDMRLRDIQQRAAMDAAMDAAAAAAAPVRAPQNVPVHPNAPVAPEPVPPGDADSETDAENEEMELDEIQDIPPENAAGRAGEEGPMDEEADSGDDDDEEVDGAVEEENPVFEGVRAADNEGGVGHDVLEQIMREAAQADVEPIGRIGRREEEDEDILAGEGSPEAALLQ